MFYDVATIKVKGGPGGNGCMSFRREAHTPRGGPNGGSGGNGGAVIVRATDRINTLIQYKFERHFKADAGGHGQGKDMHGKEGRPIILDVPIGTIVKIQRDDEWVPVADLNEVGSEVTVARGGKGGLGNAQLVTARYRAPMFAQLGEPTDMLDVQLELKLVADVGLIGLPNAGKSTLIATLTSAKPKIADYPFTTIVPNLGVVRHENDDYVIADMPGLIAGAAAGKGLGHEFLRHIERTRVLVHLLDSSSGDADLLIQDWQTIIDELREFDPRILEKPQILVLSKTDTLPEEFLAALLADSRLIKASKKYGGKGLIAISAASHQGLEALQTRLIQILKQKPKTYETPGEPIVPTLRPLEESERFFTVTREGNRFVVAGKRAERIALTTQMNNREALHWMFDRLRAMGVVDELEKKGIQMGDIVTIKTVEFEWE